ncbi:MAG: hypothetical protein DI563_12405 [Variovorax paradoxus]|uniref:Uncharacterized protein n=1 Tax=Variovorax paradoxus TaxID=34073 RepID=A0A2W5RUT8_VARPD|nr:MAG: hypothetical protein DI563_12405 [Variovorax paradoxus]
MQLVKIPLYLVVAMILMSAMLIAMVIAVVIGWPTVKIWDLLHADRPPPNRTNTMQPRSQSPFSAH